MDTINFTPITIGRHIYTVAVAEGTIQPTRLRRLSFHISEPLCRVSSSSINQVKLINLKNLFVF